MLTRTADEADLLETFLEQADEPRGYHLFSCPDFDIERFIGGGGPLSIRPSHEGLFSPVDTYGAAGDFSRTPQDFDFHTDGLYEAELPQWVLLHCRNPGTATAVTVLADSEAAFANLPVRDQHIARMLETVYIGRHGDRFARPLVRTTGGGVSTIQMVSRGFLRPTDLQPDRGDHLTVRDIAEFTGTLFAALEAAIVATHDWSVDDVLVFDNHRFPHARRSVSGRVDPGRRLDRLWFDL